MADAAAEAKSTIINTQIDPKLRAALDAYLADFQRQERAPGVDPVEHRGGPQGLAREQGLLALAPGREAGGRQAAEGGEGGCGLIHPNYGAETIARPLVANVPVAPPQAEESRCPYCGRRAG
jgi:hypothetical protein